MRRQDCSCPSPGLLPVVVRTALGAVAALLLAGCSGGLKGAGSTVAYQDPGMGHVHGLGVDSSSGDVLVATHTGLFRVRDGVQPQRVADRWQDTMAFTVDGDRLLASGHPDRREELPVHLGLIESSDVGRTWEPVSLQGDADFHALSVADQEVVGWDSLSGAVLSSGDGGRSWATGAALDTVADLEHLPGDGGLLATTADGLLVSHDAGLGFEPFTPTPPTTLVHIESTGRTVTGVDSEGGVWGLEVGSWVEQGSVGAPPTAFAASADGTLLAATERQVLRLDDRDWTVVADVAGTS